MYKKYTGPKQVVSAFFLAAACALASCAHSPEKPADQSAGATATSSNNEPARKTYAEEAEGHAITNSAAQTVDAQQYVEISYKPGSAALTPSSERSLARLLTAANAEGKIRQVMVLSWADHEMPSEKQKKLSKTEIDLANKRNKSVETYLKTGRKVSVDSYNMAEQPNVFSKWFNTTDSKLKNALVAAGLPTTANDPQYSSKASSSVVLVRLAQ